MNDLTLLIDSSSLLYRAFYSTPDTVTAPDGSLINAAHGFLNMVARLVSDCDPSRIACATDEDWRPQWRVDLVPEYKLARVAPAEPQAEADDEVGRQSVFCFELLASVGVAVVGHDCCEAEDVIGTLAAREKQPVAIVSGDRDLFQLVEDPNVFVLYPIKGVSEMARIDEAEIVRRYGIPGRAYADYAVLRGDPSDGLPGVKGVGDKTAAALAGHPRVARRGRGRRPPGRQRRRAGQGGRPPRLRGAGHPGRAHPPRPAPGRSRHQPARRHRRRRPAGPRR